MGGKEVKWASGAGSIVTIPVWWEGPIIVIFAGVCGNVGVYYGHPGIREEYQRFIIFAG